MNENNNVERVCVNYTFGKSKTVDTSVKAGISFGSALGMVISYVTWQSIPWAILHGLLGWVYVVYYLLKY